MFSHGNESNDHTIALGTNTNNIQWTEQKSLENLTQLKLPWAAGSIPETGNKAHKSFRFAIKII
jgi:hypothetical protein